jgi:ADP-ribose pyrophosphatase YjhB (NUDIX family)
VSTVPVTRSGIVDRSLIKVKALAVIVNDDATQHVVLRARDETGREWHRPLGGGVELGERAVAAVVREIAEELGATLESPELLGVLENIFELNGELGHEVAFVYAGTLAEPDVVPESGRSFMDLDVRCWAEWRPLSDPDPAVDLYPPGVQDLIVTWLAGQATKMQNG